LSSTIVVSIASKKIHKLNFINDLIKKDYKLDNYNYDKSIIYIIPIINLGYLIKNIKKYNMHNLEFLKKNILIVPLTENEKNIYNEYPSITTAININLFKKKKSNMIVMDLEDGDENTLYVTNDNDNYIINDSKGPISKLPKKEQYIFLKEELEAIEIAETPKVKVKK